MKSLLPFLRHLAMGGALTSSALNAAESSLILRMPPGWSGFELEATVETGYRPAGMTAPEVATSDTQTATVSPAAGHPAGATITVPTATANSRPTSGDRKDRASASLDLRYVIGSDTEPDRFVFDYSTTTSAVAADHDFGSGLQKADAFARVTVVVRSTAPLLAADFPGASFRVPDMPALTDPASESAIATFRIPRAGRPPETATSYVPPNTGFLTAGNPGVLFFLDMLPATPLHGDETLEYTFSYEVVTPFRSDPTFSYMQVGEAALTRTVVTNTNDDGAGSLRQALLDVPPTGAITFAPDLEGQTINLTSGQLEMTGRDFSINANELSEKVTIDADGLSRVLQVTNNSDLRLHNLTLTGGSVRGTGRGGGILVQDSALTLTDCGLLGNHAPGNGGGIASDRSVLRLVRTLVQSNSSDGLGGGVVTNRGLLTSAEVVLIDSEFVNNTALSGGAVTWDGTHISDFQFTRCSFLDNEASERGGALYRVKGPFDHCTFWGNMAGLGGGAIYQTVPTEIRHCTINNNVAPADQGGGVLLAPGINVTVFSSIIAGNGSTDLDVPASTKTAFRSAGFNVIGDGNGAVFFTEGGDVTGIISQTIGLGYPGYFGGPTRVQLPRYNSPATDAGATDLNSPTIDQRGFPRVADGDGDGIPMVDAGAAESERPVMHVYNNNDGGSGSLRQAIMEVPDGGLIVFDPGGANVGLTSGSLFMTGKTVTIDGGTISPVGRASISANQRSGLFGINSQNANVTLRNLRLTGGNGSAIVNIGTLLVEDCDLTDNTGAEGAAIANIGRLGFTATATLNRCSIGRNHALEAGGAILNRGILVVTDSTFAGNSSDGAAGAIWMPDRDQSTILRRCVISNNLGQTGGGLSLGAGNLIADRCSFHGNYARTKGGALTVEGSGEARLDHCTLWSNFADLEGGALWTNGGIVRLQFCTVSGNEALSGGGLFMGTRPGALDPATVTIRSSIVAGNSDDDLVHQEGQIVSSGYNVAGLGSGLQFFTGPGDQTGIADPVLSPPGNFGGDLITLLPLPGSPALENGARDGVLPGLDQRGQPRLRDGDGDGEAYLDAGASEAPVPSTAQLVTTAADSGAGSLRQAIADATTPGARITFFRSLDGETLNLGAPLTISRKYLLIDAHNLPSGFTLDGGGASTVLSTRLESGVALRNLTLQRGGPSPHSPGGGIISEGALTLASCRLLENDIEGILGAGLAASGKPSTTVILLDSEVSQNGAASESAGCGVHTADLNSIFLNCSLRNNTSTGLGGGLCNGGGYTHLRECDIRDNRARHGAGVFQSGFTMMSRSTIDGNQAISAGGGINSYRGIVRLFDCTLSANSAQDGGAFNSGFIFSYDPSAWITQCTIFQNSARSYGGAFSCEEGNITIRHSTITDNQAATTGGGIAITAGGAGPEVTLFASIVAGNQETDLAVVPGAADGFQSLSWNLIGQTFGTTAFGPPGDRVGILDPLLSVPGFYGGPTQTIIPLPGSLARDGVLALSSPPPFDQRGFPRLFGPAIDIGAYEASGQGGYPIWAQEFIPPGEDMNFAGNADDDRNPNGLEYGVDTNPDHSDPSSPNNAVVSDKEGIMRIAFGFRPEAFDVIWRVVRSTNLRDWAEIYRYDGTTETLAPGIDSDFDLLDRLITVADTNPPVPEAYYRLELIYTPLP